MKVLSILLIAIVVICIAYKYGELRYRDGLYDGAGRMLEAENYRDSLRNHPGPAIDHFDHILYEK